MGISGLSLVIKKVGKQKIKVRINSDNKYSNTLSLNSSVKIINSSGDNPEVQLFYSSSGEGSANSCNQVCQYSITWSYNYCG